MKFLRRHPLFASLIALLALIIIAEVWYVVVLRGDVAIAETEVQHYIGEIETLQGGKPAPINENLRTAREELANNAGVLTRMLRELNVTGPDDFEYFKGEPTTRPDAWFAISQFVDRMTKEAKAGEVEIQPEERFGFATYTFEGPEPLQIQGVYREHRIVEYLLGKLFAARPQRLLGVQREEPASKPLAAGSGPATPVAAAAAPASARGKSEAAAGGDHAEIFVIDPQVSARTPGYVKTMAFRIIFAGQSRSLRGFMNALAAPDIPLVVRSVEVRESGPATGRPGSGPASAGRPARPGNPFSTPTAKKPVEAANNPSAVPIVAENASVFTVTVEFFEVEIRAPNVTTTAATP